MKRRHFLQLSLATSAATLLPAPLVLAKPAAAPKKILILGGTNFIGPALVEQALAQGHEVTLFNRGITRPHLFPEIEKLRGTRDRTGSNLSALAGNRRWDAVVDVWPEHSSLVDETTQLLADRADYYFFVSSIAVYRDFSQPNISETAAIHRNDPGWYGGEKVLAEQLVASRFPDRYGVARCHAILGPRDNGTAYHYWLRRLALSDQVIAPGTGNDPVQYTDVRDVAGWILNSIENNRSGTYNLCGPSETLTFRAFLEGTHVALDSSAELVWMDPDFLRQEQEVRSFTNLPLWAPLDEDRGFYQVDASKAIAAGATFRPLAETARDAWHWYQSYFFKDTAFPLGGMGLSSEREQAILQAWRDRG